MKTLEINDLIQKCILLSQERKDFLKRNFIIFPEQKQVRIIKTLEQIKNISATADDFEVFSYGMKIWKNKKKLQYLESQDI